MKPKTAEQINTEVGVGECGRYMFAQIKPLTVADSTGETERNMIRQEVAREIFEDIERIKDKYLQPTNPVGHVDL